MGRAFASLRSWLAGTLRLAFTNRPRPPPRAPTDVTRRDPIGSSWDRWSLAGGPLSKPADNVVAINSLIKYVYINENNFVCHDQHLYRCKFIELWSKV